MGHRETVLYNETSSQMFYIKSVDNHSEPYCEKF